jgi:hypothetical protein
MRTRIVGWLPVMLLLPLAAYAKNYKAERMTDHGVDVVRLTDVSHGIEVTVVPSIGNRAIQMKVHGKDIIYFQNTDAGDFKAHPAMSSIPPTGSIITSIWTWATCAARCQATVFL